MFYNLVNYCFSRQDSRDPEHTWPEGTYLNNCFSCLTQRRRGGEGREVEANGLVTLCSTYWNVNWSQDSPFLSLILLLPSFMFMYGDGWLAVAMAGAHPSLFMCCFSCWISHLRARCYAETLTPLLQSVMILSFHMMGRTSVLVRAKPKSGSIRRRHCSTMKLSLQALVSHL